MSRQENKTNKENPIHFTAQCKPKRNALMRLSTCAHNSTEIALRF